jgi:hypothetical protein
MPLLQYGFADESITRIYHAGESALRGFSAAERFDFAATLLIRALHQRQLSRHGSADLYLIFEC